MTPSLDVHKVFKNPKRVIAALKAGKTIALIDDDGQVFARVTPCGLYHLEDEKPSAQKRFTNRTKR